MKKKYDIPVVCNSEKLFIQVGDENNLPKQTDLNEIVDFLENNNKIVVTSLPLKFFKITNKGKVEIIK